MKLSESLIVRKPLELIRKAAQYLTTVRAQSSWLNWGPIHEPYAGAWQRNVTVDAQTSLLAFSAVFACVTGIASDIAKMRIKLDIDDAGIWKEVTSDAPWLPVLRKPNQYQTRIKFIEQWIVSKLLHGNAYILKQRNDKRGIVTGMYVLDPTRVTVLVADDGSVYYQLRQDFLSRIPEDVTIPASEIIHDTMVCLWHPLIGVSPLYACGVSATMGNRIQSNSTNLFGNASIPGGVISVPGNIDDVTAKKLKERWETNYGGANVGRIAVLGDGMTFSPVVLSAEVMQLIDQLRWTVEDVARAFHYPGYKLGGPMPPYSSNLEALNMGYYTDCLQSLIESLELSLDEGLELPANKHTELDLDNLLRMDTVALYDSNAKAVGGGWMSPNEARFRANLDTVPGGESPMLQQQNWSLAMLAQRTAPTDASVAVAPVVPPGITAQQPVKQLTAAMAEEDIDTETDSALRRELSFV